MSTKKITITGCKEHNFWMPNNLELLVGSRGENYLTRCSGCAVRGFMWNANAPQPTFLTIANFDNNDVANYCVYCSAGILERVLKGLNRLVARCPCKLCSFNTKTNPQTPQNLMNSPQPITICFCSLSDFNILGKLNQEIFNYQRSEHTRNYKNLVPEKTIIKDLICDECNKSNIDNIYYQVKVDNRVSNLCETCKNKIGDLYFDDVSKRS